jgi:hypothetical protein
MTTVFIRMIAVKPHGGGFDVNIGTLRGDLS